MTTVIAIRHCDGVRILADSGIACDPEIEQNLERKVWEPVVAFGSTPLYIGIAGSHSDGQLVRYGWEPPTYNEKPVPQDRPADFHRYMTTEFIPSLRAFAKEQGMLGSNPQEPKSLGNINLLVCAGTEMRLITSWLSCDWPPAPFQAIGTSERWVKGALDAMYLVEEDERGVLGPLQPDVMVGRAMRVALSRDMYTRLPIHCWHTRRGYMGQVPFDV